MHDGPRLQNSSIRGHFEFGWNKHRRIKTAPHFCIIQREHTFKINPEARCFLRQQPLPHNFGNGLSHHHGVAPLQKPKKADKGGVGVNVPNMPDQTVLSPTLHKTTIANMQFRAVNEVAMQIGFQAGLPPPNHIEGDLCVAL